MTSFDDIYSLNSVITDYVNMGEKPDNIYYYVLYKWLEFAIGAFCEYSYIDITEYTPFKQEIYIFNTPNTQTDFVLDTAPPTDSIFYITVDDVKIGEDEYSFDSNTNTITIPSGGGELYIGAYIYGSFTNTLTIKEKVILADAMTEWFVESNLNDSSAQEQIMYAGVEFHSQAQHNKTNLDIEKFRSTKSFKNMLFYTYTKNMPDTIFLAKRGGVTYE